MHIDRSGGAGPYSTIDTPKGRTEVSGYVQAHHLIGSLAGGERGMARAVIVGWASAAAESS